MAAGDSFEPAGQVEPAAVLAAARAAYQRRDWVTARTGLLAADAAAPLAADDRYALANCSWWLGELDLALPAMQEAYRQFLAAARPGPAALVALDIGYTLLLRGDLAQGTGWLARGRRLLQDQPDSAEYGYLVYIDFEHAFDGVQLARASDLAHQVHEYGRRHQDPTLVALGVLGQGRVALRQGNVDEGMALLDEAMVAAVSDELDPSWSGNIYCHLMAACFEIADLRRAGEWTQATARWCEQMPGAGPFLGICRVHRAQVLHVRGDWQRAEQEALRVCEELAHFSVATVAEAHYLLGDLARLRGEPGPAEGEFLAAGRLGRDPQPGLALLRLAQGQVEMAAASIRTALAAAGTNRPARGRLLPAAVEIALASGDTDWAGAASDELSELADRYGSTGFVAAARQARGVVLLAGGDPAAALPELREALRHWQEVGSLPEMVRVRAALAQGYDALGDHDSAQRERAAAHREREQLGTSRAEDRVTRPPRPGGLTDREAEVLSLVAGGRTNQQIAADLVLSIRTVERHLATAYQKLGVSGRSARAAAVSFALREGLLPPPAT